MKSVAKVLAALTAAGVGLQPALAGEGFHCNLKALTQVERSRDVDLAKELGASVVEKVVLPGGYAFRFARDRLGRVAEWTAIIAKCCQPLTFQVEIGPEPEGQLWLRVTGAEGAKAFLDIEFASFLELAAKARQTPGGTR
jgi:hypothetical protein